MQSVVLQPDGKVLAAGIFNALNGTHRIPIVRLHSDGSRDGSFVSAIGTHNNSGAIVGNVRAITLQPDGRVLVGGAFHTTDDATVKVVARLNADGSLDGSFTPGTGVIGIVYCAAIQLDGKLLAGGSFTIVNDTARWYVACLPGDSLAPSLDIALSDGFAIVSWPASAAAWQLQEFWT